MVTKREISKMEISPFTNSYGYELCANPRSSNTQKLNVPWQKTETAGRSFSAAAPRVWNDLLIELRQTISMTSFKSKLKFSFQIETLFTNCCHPRLRISVNLSNHYCHIFGTYGVYKIKIYLSIYLVGCLLSFPLGSSPSHKE